MTNGIEKLLKAPLWQMTGEEFFRLLRYALHDSMCGKKAEDKVLVTGVRSLAEYLACCESMVYKLLRSGSLERAIVSHIGKKWVFDGEKARECANSYMQQQRMIRNETKD